MADAPKGSKKVKVVATKMGYYGHKRRREGDVFFFVQKGGEKLPKWMELEATYAKRKAEEAEAALDDSPEPAGDEESVI